MEDWLLLVIPAGTFVVSLVVLNVQVADLGLFFGMVGKSLASTSLPLSGQPQPPQVGTPPSGMGGNRNYILWDGCNPMVNPSVSFVAGSDIHASGNWDLQVNVYAPSGTDAYMQFVLAVTTTGEVQWSVENWPISGSNLFNTCDQHLFQLPSTFLPSGYSIGLKMNTDAETRNVTSLVFSVTDPGGGVVASRTVPLDSMLPVCNGNWNASYLSRVAGFEPNIVGYNGGTAVSFSVGCTGSLRCSAATISASPSILRARRRRRGPSRTRTWATRRPSRRRPPWSR